MKKNNSKSITRSRSSYESKDRVIKIVEPLHPEAMAKKLQSFEVTTDSVVATANLIFESDHQFLTLHWGDDEKDVINLHQLRLISLANGSAQAPNSLRVQHVYHEPFDRGQKLVVAVTTDNEGKKAWDAVMVDTDPRFKLNFYSIVMEFPDHLDSIFEINSELDITLRAVQNSRIFFFNSWKDSITTDPQFNIADPIQWRLEGSHFSREISFNDEPIAVEITVDENDGIGDPGSFINGVWDIVSAPFKGLHTIYDLAKDFPHEFDGSAPGEGFTFPRFIIHPSRDIYTFIDFRIGTFPEEGHVIARLSYELKLIVPLDNEMRKLLTVST
jgi:hypothetical protein